MKKLILLVALVAFATPAVSQVRVKGYTRSDGTYVAPHYRSKPDSSTFNNYSSPGKFNPYTGKTAPDPSAPPTDSYGFKPLAPIAPIAPIPPFKPFKW